MDNADERRSKAREILLAAADYWIGRDENPWKFSFADNGDVLIFYEGSHVDSSGSFSCCYNILPAIEKMLAEMERRVDGLTFDAPRTDGAGMMTTPLGEHVNKQGRRETAETAARFATVLLIGHFAQKFAGVMPEAVDDALLVAETGINSVIAKGQDDAALAYVAPDVRPAIKQRGEESSASRIEQLTTLLRLWSHVQLEAMLGRPPKVTKADLLAAIEARKKAGKPVSSVEIAGDLDVDESTIRKAVAKHKIEMKRAE
jgi:hypothetical protein